MVFRANDGLTGAEMWSTDGTPGGTVLVKDVRSGGLSSSPGEFTLSNGRVLFHADDGMTGRELWSFDPSATAQTYGVGCSFSTAPQLTSTDPVLGANIDSERGARRDCEPGGSGAQLPASSAALRSAGGGSLIRGPGARPGRSHYRGRSASGRTALPRRRD